MKKSHSVSLLIFLVFVVVTLTGTLCHEMWRDELQVWLLTRNSHSLAELLHNTRYEGHPILWHILVYPFSHMGNNMLWMSFLNLVIAWAFFYLLAFYSPFNPLQKILTALGYFLVFEYTVLARNYAIEILLLFILCILYARERKNWLVIAGVLWLLCQTNIFGVFFALGFTALFLSAMYGKTGNRQLLGLLLILFSGLALAAFQVIPPADTGYSVGWHFTYLPNFFKAFTTVFKSYVPIPEPVYGFWNSHLIMDKTTKLLLTLVFLGIISLRFMKKRDLLAFFWICNMMVWIFFYSKHYGTIRHHGHVYIIFLICLWLEPYVPIRPLGIRRLEKVNINPVFNAFVVVIFGIQAAVGSYAIFRDCRDPFSQSKRAAEYIRANHLDRYTIVGDKDFVAMPLSAFLEKPIFYPSRMEFGTYVKWDNKRRYSAPLSEVLSSTRKLATDRQQDILLVTDYPLDIEKFRFLRKIATFETAIVDDEVYFIYIADHKKIRI